MSKKTAVVVDGVREVHMIGDGTYATLCGVDGDDPNAGQFMSTVNDHEKINCAACVRLWTACRAFSRGDFLVPPSTAKETKP